MMKTLISKQIFNVIEFIVSSVIVVGIAALAWPSINDHLENSRDQETVEHIVTAKNEADVAFETQSSIADNIVFVSYPEKVGDDGNTKAMVAVKDFVANGTKLNNFSDLADDLPCRSLFHGTMDNLDDGSGKSYIIEFKYNQAGELYIIQAFEQDSYNMAIFE